MKLLIIEDEILIQKSLKKLLERKGADVTCVSSGRQAIEILKKNDYNRIICDLMLQDITGFDIIESCVKFLSKELISQKFVIMTAYSSDQVLNKASEYGCPVIRKPFEDLDEALQIMLDFQYEN